MLPGASGLEVLDRMRQAKPTLPVIVLTAQGDVEHRVTGLDAGAADYIVKPFSLSELAARSGLSSGSPRRRRRRRSRRATSRST